MSTLKLVADWLKKNPQSLSATFTDGRSNSTVNEQEVVKALINAGLPIKEAQDRTFRDFIVVGEEDTNCDIKIIAIDFSKSSGCNAVCGAATFARAIANTDAQSMKWAKLYDVVHDTDVVPEANMWFLVIDKNDVSNIMLRELGQINDTSLIWNPSNGLQIDWGNEWNLNPISRTPLERKEWLIKGLKILMQKKYNSIRKWIEKDEDYEQKE